MNLQPDLTFSSSPTTDLAWALTADQETSNNRMSETANRPMNGTLNIPNETTSPLNETGLDYQLPAEKVIVPSLFALIFIVGVVGNGTLVMIFARDRNLRTVPNTYIISLALGDLLVLFFTVPFVTVIYIVDVWPFGELMCKLTEFMRDVSIGVTVFTLTALSADRYLAIVSTFRKLTSAEGGQTVMVAVGIWVLSAVLALPSAVSTQVERFTPDNNQTNETLDVCFPFPESYPDWYPSTMVVLRVLVYYILPLAVITVFYALMASHLLSADEVPAGSHAFDNHLRTRKKVAKIVLCFVIIFAVCFLPTHVFMLWYHLQDEDSAQKNFNMFWRNGGGAATRGCPVGAAAEGEVLSSELPAAEGRTSRSFKSSRSGLVRSGQVIPSTCKCREELPVPKPFVLAVSRLITADKETSSKIYLGTVLPLLPLPVRLHSPQTTPCAPLHPPHHSLCSSTPPHTTPCAPLHPPYTTPRAPLHPPIPPSVPPRLLHPPALTTRHQVLTQS